MVGDLSTPNFFSVLVRLTIKMILMSMSRFTKLSSTVAAICISASMTHADNWTQYRGPAGDGISKETAAAVDWSSGAKILWKVPTPLGFSSFVIADGLAITVIAENNREICVALDSKSGKELWRTPMGSTQYDGGGGDSGADGNRGGDGPRSTPSIDGDRVYVYDAHLVLYCMDAREGIVLWSQDIAAGYEGRNIKWSNATSPVIEGDRVIVAGGGAGKSLLAFDKTKGNLVWQSGDEKLTHATPVVATIHGKRQVLFLMQSGLIGVDAQTGKEIWRAKFPFSTSTAASPVVSGNFVYCSAGYGVGASLFEIDADGNANEIWFQANELMNHWSTPVIHDGHLYGIFEFKKYGKAPLQCVELKTGEIKWAERGFGPGNCILVGERLMVLSDAGEVAIVQATPDAYRELARAKVIEGKCWSTPAFANGQLYVRSTKEAACIDVGN
jgi:outer membrane protein assembly factor BamB